jgi:ribosome-associated protein
VQAIADHVLERLAEEGSRPRGVEGFAAARWVLLDYGDVIVHVFRHEDREYYGLEQLWGDAPEVELEPEPGAAYNEGRPGGDAGR